MKSLLFAFEYRIFLLIYHVNVAAALEDRVILNHENPSDGFTFLVHWSTMVI